MPKDAPRKKATTKRGKTMKKSSASKQALKDLESRRHVKGGDGAFYTEPRDYFIS
jgi:hypothetical protein